MSSVVDASSAVHAERAVLCWRVHRLRDSPRGALSVALGYGLAVFLWRIITPQPFILIALLTLLTAALSDYLFPVTYRLTTAGAHTDGLISRLYLSWEDVKRATHGADGVFLSPLSRRSRLDEFRGVRLRYGAEDASAVRDTVRRLWKGDRA